VVDAVGPRGEGLAIVTEQLAEFGGVERIVEALMTRFPAATLVAGRFAAHPDFPPDEFAARLRERGAHPPALSLIGSRPRRRRHFLAPLYAQRARALRLDAAAAVLSLGSTGWTLAVEVPPGARHVAYVGGPPRAYWGHTRQYLAEYHSAVRPLIRASMPALRAQYRGLLRRPLALATNSAASAGAIEAVAGFRPPVMYPPVRTGFFTPDSGRERRHFLVVARLRAHKRVDVILEAFRRLGEPLVVAGAGPWSDRLRASAPPNVTFAGHVGDAELRELYRGSRALVSASVEEFGLCLAEAQAAGVPVVAPNAGGSVEIVRRGETGVLFDRVDPESVEHAVRRLAAVEIDPAACRRYAMRFSEERFVAELESMLGIGAVKLAS
jgi:glycosyltransferase involved in cell wall biosynthesis